MTAVHVCCCGMHVCVCGAGGRCQRANWGFMDVRGGGVD